MEAHAKAMEIKKKIEICGRDLRDVATRQHNVASLHGHLGRATEKQQTPSLNLGVRLRWELGFLRSRVLQTLRGRSRVNPILGAWGVG